MELQDLLKLSPVELASRVQELESRIQELEDERSRLIDLMDKVREHKHNYSGDFGLVVSAPIQALVKEVISNPDAFIPDDIDRIIKIYADSAEMRGTYECLGWRIEEKLEKVKEVMVPKIRENVEFFSSIVGQNKTEYNNTHLIDILRMALNESESLCDNLENIESFKYGISEPFNLKAEILSAFKGDNSKRGLLGKTTIQIEKYFGDLSDVQVSMSKKAFRSHVLGNIIKNLHDHAFVEDSTSTFPILNIRLSLWKKILSCFFSRLFTINLQKTFSVGDYFEKKVLIKLIKDEKSDHRVNLIIENNGKEFKGDRDAIFDKGVGSGEGIGLYSARQFLKHYGANIDMLEKVDDGYKVGFIINLPIYGSNL